MGIPYPIPAWPVTRKEIFLIYSPYVVILSVLW